MKIPQSYSRREVIKALSIGGLASAPLSSPVCIPSKHMRQN